MTTGHDGSVRRARVGSLPPEVLHSAPNPATRQDAAVGTAEHTVSDHFRRSRNLVPLRQAEPAGLSLPTARATGMLAPVIDPDSAVPPYEQVAKILRDEIAQGTMTGRIPSAHTIAEHHQVSHRVAARALEILQGEGMIENVPGEGHVVRHPRT